MLGFVSNLHWHSNSPQSYRPLLVCVRSRLLLPIAARWTTPFAVANFQRLLITTRCLISARLDTIYRRPFREDSENVHTMYRCRHEQDEDPYASGNENRRRNRDRLNRDIERHNFLRQISRGGFGAPFGGPLGLPDGMYGLGQPDPPPFGLGSRGPGFGPSLSTFCRPPGFLGCPGMWGPRFDPRSDADDSDSDDDEYPSPWYPPPPPPWYGTSPLCTLRLPPRSLYGRRCGRGFGRPHDSYYTDSLHDDYYSYMPRPSFQLRCGRY